MTSALHVQTRLGPNQDVVRFKKSGAMLVVVVVECFWGVRAMFS